MPSISEPGETRVLAGQEVEFWLMKWRAGIVPEIFRAAPLSDNSYGTGEHSAPESPTGVDGEAIDLQTSDKLLTVP